MDNNVVTIDLDDLKAKLWDELKNSLDDEKLTEEDVLIQFIHQANVLDVINAMR